MFFFIRPFANYHPFFIIHSKFVNMQVDHSHIVQSQYTNPNALMHDAILVIPISLKLINFSFFHLVGIWDYVLWY